MKFHSGHMLSSVDETGFVSRNFNDTITRIVSPSNESYEEYLRIISLEEATTESACTYSNTALYSPICYFPQALCFFVTRIFGMNYLTQMIIARIGNFLF